MEGGSAAQLSRTIQRGSSPKGRSAAAVQLLFVCQSPEEQGELRRRLETYDFLQLIVADEVGGKAPLTESPDVVLIEASRGCAHEGLDLAVKRSATFYPKAPILVLNGSHESRSPELVQLGGISGILSRNAAPDSIAAAVLLADRGFSVLPRPALDRLRQAARRGAPGPAPKRDRAAAGEGPVELTRRQEQVVELLLEGLSNRDIAGRLGIAESTVKVHVRSIMARAGVMSRTQLVLSVLSQPD